MWKVNAAYFSCSARTLKPPWKKTCRKSFRVKITAGLSGRFRRAAEIKCQSEAKKKNRPGTSKFGCEETVMGDFNSMFPKYLGQCLSLKTLLTPIAYLLITGGLIASTIAHHRSGSASLQAVGRVIVFIM